MEELFVATILVLEDDRELNNTQIIHESKFVMKNL